MKLPLYRRRYTPPSLGDLGTWADAIDAARRGCRQARAMADGPADGSKPPTLIIHMRDCADCQRALKASA